MRRVLFVSASSRLGGAERSMVELAGELAAGLGGEIALQAALPEPGPAADILRDLGVRVHYIPIPRIARTSNPVRIAETVAAIAKAARSIADLARAERIDILHANNDRAQLCAGEAASRAGVPCVWHARDMIDLWPVLGRVSSKASAIVAVSRAVESFLVERGVPPGKVRVIPNGISLARFKYADREAVRRKARRELGLGEGFVAGSAGVFIPWKRHDDFIRAFVRLCELEVLDRRERPSGPGSTRVSMGGLVADRAVLFGADIHGADRDLEPELRRLAQAGVGERLIFAGWRNDLAACLPALDVFVSPSENEPFGRVLVEAMAAGVPVVSTASGGKVDMIEHGRTGLLVPQGDVNAMAEALHELKLSPAKRGAIAEAAAARVRTEFSVERVAREMAEVYRGLAPSQ